MLAIKFYAQWNPNAWFESKLYILWWATQVFKPSYSITGEEESEGERERESYSHASYVTFFG